MTKLTPPPLSNDCFAMPRGAHWTPEEEALAHLRQHLSCVKATVTIPTHQAAGSILSEDVRAERSHPPTPNSAVDGYALLGPIAAGAHELPLVEGRSAAGQPFDGNMPVGSAIRILTGATLPNGVDTVILQEDVSTDGKSIAFNGPLKQGANARKAGEDMVAGAAILRQGRHLKPADIGTLVAAGVAQVPVFEKLKVGVLSTGDELRNPEEPAADGDIYDANRPMLLANVARWGFDAIDLGRAPDDREELRATLDDAATTCDAILTSGGASAGDEDHLSALLQEAASFALWRVAIKPGRPLSLGVWNGTPVFGLPGNPVAAQVCALVFGYPSLLKLAGADWVEPQGFPLPAMFSKNKKEGRVEYLRARVSDARVEVFQSEGSGRISGLSWATGLVRLPHHAININQGDLVQYIPYESFGL